MSIPSAKEVIERRMNNTSSSADRSDAFRLGLVIEGGGMRGVISGAMTGALENLGMFECFDAVYGASAGAMAAAYFVAGSARAGATIYYEHINNRRFVNPWRLVSLRPVMDLDFLIYDVFKNNVPLDCSKIIQSSCALNVVTTDARSGEKYVLSSFVNEEELLLALKASASNPIFGVPPVVLRGSGYWDAILTESIPAQTAIEDGCTHIIVLRSRPVNETRSKIGLAEKLLAKRFIRSKSEHAYKQYLKKSDAYISEGQLIDKLGDRSITIAPSGRVQLSQSCISRKKLLSAAADGYRSVLEQFNYADSVVTPMIGHYLFHPG